MMATLTFENGTKLPIKFWRSFNFSIVNIKSDFLEIFKIYKEGRKNYFLILFLSIGFEKATNGEYISGEKIFFGPFWSPGEPSEDRPIKHRENTFMLIKIDRIIRFCPTFF